MGREGEGGGDLGNVLVEILVGGWGWKILRKKNGGGMEIGFEKGLEGESGREVRDG